jgi:hypothetical protein
LARWSEVGSGNGVSNPSGSRTREPNEHPKLLPRSSRGEVRSTVPRIRRLGLLASRRKGAWRSCTHRALGSTFTRTTSWHAYVYMARADERVVRRAPSQRTRRLCSSSGMALGTPVHARGHGGDGRVLEARVAHPRGKFRADPGERAAREERARSQSDVNDAHWPADLLAHGLVRGSYVPERPIQELRDLTRTRKQLVRQRARHVNVSASRGRVAGDGSVTQAVRQLENPRLAATTDLSGSPRQL